MQIVYVSGIILSVILNMMVIIVLVKKKRDINHIDLCIISLAVSDLLQAGLGYSLEIYSFHYDTAMLSKIWCNISGFSITYLALVSICHFVGLSLERYLVLKYPLKARAWYARPWIGFYIIVPSWIYALGCSLPPLFGWSSYKRLNDATLMCQVDLISEDKHMQSYLWFLLTACFAIPLIFIVIFSILLLRQTRIVRHEIATLGVDEKHLARRREGERKLAIITIIIVCVFVVAWAPYTACVFVYSAKSRVSDQLLFYSAIFAKMSTIHNPIIYSIFNKKFQDRCRRIFCCKTTTIPFSSSTFMSRCTSATQTDRRQLSMSCATLASTINQSTIELHTISEENNDMAKTRGYIEKYAEIQKDERERKMDSE